MMVWHPPTIACIERRIAEGLTKSDIMTRTQALFR